MRVLLGCEKSQAATSAFRSLGYDAYSNDLQSCTGLNPEYHLQMDVFKAVKEVKPHLAIFFPPCTYLSSVQTFLCRTDVDRVFKRIEAAKFFMRLYDLKIKHSAVENPTGVMTHIFRPADQVVHPFYFGGDVMKRTGLWLKQLPLLESVESDDLFSKSTYGVVPEPEKVWVQRSTGKTKFMRQVNKPFLSGEERSVLAASFAAAMASQWGAFVEQKLNTKKIYA